MKILAGGLCVLFWTTNNLFFVGATIITNTFSHVGYMQNFTVPYFLSAITFDVSGASGGTGHNFPGSGARVVVTIIVNPGSVIHISVGGKGGTQLGDGLPTKTNGGFNGGK